MFNLKILSCEKCLYDGDASALFVPGVNGYLEILPHHAPILTMLQAGTLTYRDGENKSHSLPIDKGFLEVSNHDATVLL